MSTIRNDGLGLVMRLAGLASLVAALWLMTLAAHAEGEYADTPPEMLPMREGVVINDTITDRHQTIPVLEPISATILLGPSGEILGIVQADLLAYTPTERAARRQRTQHMTRRERATEHLRENWYWWAGGIAAAVVADQTIIKNNEWLWHKNKGSSKSAGGDLIGDDAATAIALSNHIEGNGNTVTQNIVIQAPQGSGTGMQGNTGDGSLSNLDDSRNTGE